MNLNELGAITLVLSGATIIFSIIMATVGLPLRSVRNLIRSMVLEVIDLRMGNTGRRAISVRYYRFLLSIWVPLRRFFLSLTGIRNGGLALELSRQSLYVNTGLASLAMLLLVSALMLNDMTNQYVVMHSSSTLSIFYRMTSAWAGASGSLLFWYFLLTLFTAIILYQTRFRLYNRLPLLFLILGVLQLLFIMLLVFFDDAQPFRTFAMPMTSGRGLNPLLLHWAMIIHPPILYVGYVSFAIPFAVFAAAVMSGNMKDDLLAIFRRWGLFSWFFLGFGILLGSKWAYEELGWGGYWAWDPVENASLMPFLLATAFLHSLIVQHHRGMLRFWNLFLITSTYHFCLLGTWITRSGVLQGPHSFAESAIGPPMIIFIGASYVYFLRFLFFKRKVLRPDDQLQSVTSKEGSMLLNNFLMLISVVIILVGVFSPLVPLDCSFNGGLQCFKAEWKPTTYNKLMVPIGLIVLFLMGASPLLAWRKSADVIYARTLRIPLLAGIAATILYGSLYGMFFTSFDGENNSPWGPQILAEIFSVLTVGSGVFLIVGIMQEYHRGIKSRRARLGESFGRAFVQLLLLNKRRYGGYLIHLSVVFLFIGYSGGAFKTTGRLQFHYYRMDVPEGAPYVYYYSGDKAYLDNYIIEARELFLRPHFEPHGNPENPGDMTVSQEAHYRINPRDLLPVYPSDGSDPFAFANKPAPLGDRLIKFTSGFIPDGRMTTERRFYPQIYPYTGEVQKDQNGISARMATSEPDMKSSWSEDLYIQLGAIYDPMRNRNPDLAAMYEFYLYELKRDPRGYEMLFPPSIVADLEYWVNPLVKFIWLGTTLFFFAGLLILLPFGEKREEDVIEEAVEKSTAGRPGTGERY
jgi:cytochrome c-type biogenesis protein CcmF